MSALDEILAGYDALQAGQEAFYQDLHAHPELSHAEHRTAGRAAAWLQDCGFTVQTGIGGTGVVGVLANGSGPAVLLRAELDALPVKEDTGVDFASTVTVKGADGQQVPVDHACGHDMHMSCLVGMAKLMANHRSQWNGTLLALFQPAEETGDGAQGMVDDGLFKRIAAPDVALAQHLLPGIAGTVATCSGPFMATEDSIKLTVYGRGSHGALPQNSIDPVVLAAMIVVRLQTIVSREVAPGEIAVVTVGSIQAGIGPSIECHGGGPRSDHADDNPKNFAPSRPPGSGKHRAGKSKRKGKNRVLPLDHFQSGAYIAQQSHAFSVPGRGAPQTRWPAFAKAKAGQLRNRSAGNYCSFDPLAT